ncbi:MAG: hypothetical protein ACLR4V_08360, partial [Bifidobacterium bifidum]
LVMLGTAPPPRYLTSVQVSRRHLFLDFALGCRRLRLHGLQYHHGQRRRPNDGRESFVLGTVRHLQFELAEPA